MKPKILLLCCAIEFHRIENRLSSMDTLIEQEENILKWQACKIIECKPDIVL